MAPVSDDALRALIRTDPATGWRTFIDQYTPLVLGLIRRGGITDRDEMMEVYVLLCEQLSARGFERLKRQDAARGSLGGWLAVVVRHTIVDWVRSRRGRRRLFHAVRELSEFDRLVFEQFYWDERSPAEIAEALAAGTGSRADMGAVFDALGRIHAALTERHRAELLALAVRARPAIPLGDTDLAERLEDPAGDPEVVSRVARMNAAFDAALTRLPSEDAAIVRLKFIEGLSNADVERALGIRGVTMRRLQLILESLRQALQSVGVTSEDAAFARHVSLDGRAS